MLLTLAISGYRSLREVVIDLDQLTVVTGANGSGKSSFYRTLRLMSDIAHGDVIGALAAEGGLSSTLWAGPEYFSSAEKAGDRPVQGKRRSGPVALKLGFASDDYGYAMDLGLPMPSLSMFTCDPEIKAEELWVGERLRRNNVLAERHGPSVRIRDTDGNWAQAHTSLAHYDSMLTHCANAREGVDLLAVRETMCNWRFYDHFRTDPEAPARRPQIGTRTGALSSDGRDVAPALQTILEIGDGDLFDATIADAFPGCRVDVSDGRGGFEIEMHQHGLLRPLSAAELSDGTLRFILLAVALLSPRPPRLMVLNEPETSLHGDLIAPLARLILAASQRSQTVVVTHSQGLIAALGMGKGVGRVVLRKELGETLIESAHGPMAWIWPKR